jgi:hypothetical protein
MDSSQLMQLLGDYFRAAVLCGGLGLFLVAWSALVWRTCRRVLLRSLGDPEDTRAPAAPGPRPFDW